MKILLIAFILFGFSEINGQDITGSWQGRIIHIEKNSPGIEYKLEMNLKIDEKNLVTGTSKTYFFDQYFVVVSVFGRFNQEENTITLEETDYLIKNIPQYIELIRSKYFLKFSSTNNEKITGAAECILENESNSIYCSGIFKVELRKVKPSKKKK